MTTKSYLLKLIWAVLILVIFGVGFFNISYAVADYYNYDVITNIERIKPDSVTFPAITVCAFSKYHREHFIGKKVIKKDNIEIKSDNTSRIHYFLDFVVSFSSAKDSSKINASNHLDYFKILTTGFSVSSYDCFRFNAVTNKGLKLITADSTGDSYEFALNNSYQEYISENEYYNYSFPQTFRVFIGDNYLNSFKRFEPFRVDIHKHHEIEIQKEASELKWPGPYNPCKEAAVDEPYHQWNCVEACTYKQIATKYNCTIPLALFSIPGLKICDVGYRLYEDEFSPGCLEKCPLESCLSETFNGNIKTSERNDHKTSFKFSFRDLSSLNISQIPKTDWFTALNNIGGGLGLFMGIAFPNMIEFLQFIFEILLILFVHK